jgi:hypothetical protein
MIECLLRNFPGEVYDSICNDRKLATRVRNMMRYIGYAPVGETISMLIALTPVSRVSQLYQFCAKGRWRFFEQLSAMDVMSMLVEAIVDPSGNCCTSGHIEAEQHSSCAMFVLQELVEKLSVEDIGELLLQPFGYTEKLQDRLIDSALSVSMSGPRKPLYIRRAATKLLCFLLRRVADADILYLVSSSPGAAPAPAYVPNRLYPLRERIIGKIKSRIGEFMDVLIDFNGKKGEGGEPAAVSELIGPVKYSAYTIPEPFSILRSLFIELLTLTVESDDTAAALIPAALWKALIGWTLQFANNSVYHAIFYRLVFSVLR